MDQVSRPMQIALVAVVLLAGMWFTVLKPKSADSSSSAPVAQTQTQTSQPVAPGVKGLTSAIDKAKAASATSDATNARIQAATGGTASTSAPAMTSATSATKTAAAPKHTTVTKKAAATAPAAKKSGTKAATAKAVASKPAVTKTSTATAKPAAAKPAAAKLAADVDPSARLLAYLKQGKTLVVLFYGKGADDKAARKAVHQTALGDPKHVVSAYVPITKVGDYEAITSDVNVLAAPTILVISTKGKATPLTGYVDAAVVRDAVSAARTAAASAK